MNKFCILFNLSKSLFFILNQVEQLFKRNGITQDSQMSKPDFIPPITLLRQSSTIFLISNIAFFAQPIRLFIVTVTLFDVLSLI